MLPKKERLRREAFNRFFSVGKRFHSPSFQIVYSKYPTLHASVVVSKKNVKGAVARNKIRRRIYDIVRRARSEGGVTGVFIFVTKRDIEKQTYATLKSEILTSVHTILTKK